MTMRDQEAIIKRRKKRRAVLRAMTTNELKDELVETSSRLGGLEVKREDIIEEITRRAR